VIEEPHAGRDRNFAGAIEVQGDKNLGFLGIAGDLGSARHDVNIGDEDEMSKE
jgi:hypothetical protein